MKILFYVLSALFLVFAGLQWNDPDPWNWIILYGYMSAICWMTARGRYQRWAILVGLFAYTAYAIVLLPSFLIWFQSSDKGALFDEFAKMQNQYIEETREFLGLLLCMLTLISILWVNRNKTSR
jgi:hypothetical protein